MAGNPKAATAKAASPKPTPQPGIADIAPYVPGTSALPGTEAVVKLSSNETPLGPSPKAAQAYAEAAAHISRYPDGSAAALRDALAARHGLDRERIVCGAGSDELLNLLAAAYLGPGDEAIYSEHGFLVYKIAILAHGATPVVAPETNLTANVDAILACVTDATRMVFLANPNNPTGTYLPRGEVRRLHEGLPAHVMLVLDAAYAEYVQAGDYEAGTALVEGNENVVMTRTFSKIHGLAALRLGWAYCPPAIADTLNRIRGPFNVSGPSIAAGVAAVNDTPHSKAAAAHNAIWLGEVRQALLNVGLDVTPSAANFVLVHFPGAPGKSAHDANAFLQARRIILRQVDEYGFPNALRMTIGTEEENRQVIEALTQFMSAP